MKWREKKKVSERKIFFLFFSYHRIVHIVAQEIEIISYFPRRYSITMKFPIRNTYTAILWRLILSGYGHQLHNISISLRYFESISSSPSSNFPLNNSTTLILFFSTFFRHIDTKESLPQQQKKVKSRHRRRWIMIAQLFHASQVSSHFC